MGSRLSIERDQVKHGLAKATLDQFTVRSRHQAKTQEASHTVDGSANAIPRWSVFRSH
jgi:hypothetical protein